MDSIQDRYIVLCTHRGQIPLWWKRSTLICLSHVDFMLLKLFCIILHHFIASTCFYFLIARLFLENVWEHQTSSEPLDYCIPSNQVCTCLLVMEQVEAYLAQKLGKVFIIHFNAAWCWRLEADLFMVTSCEDKVTIIWQHTRPTGSNHQKSHQHTVLIYFRREKWS